MFMLQSKRSTHLSSHVTKKQGAYVWWELTLSIECLRIVRVITFWCHGNVHVTISKRFKDWTCHSYLHACRHIYIQTRVSSCLWWNVLQSQTKCFCDGIAVPTVTICPHPSQRYALTLYQVAWNDKQRAPRLRERCGKVRHQGWVQRGEEGTTSHVCLCAC
jgi:hypothetical protein